MYAWCMCVYDGIGRMAREGGLACKCVDFHHACCAVKQGRERVTERDEQLSVSSGEALLVWNAYSLTAHCGMPDPDLLVVFGSATTLGGYPPWRMRFSEIQ